VLDNGKGETVFYLPATQTDSEMSNTEEPGAASATRLLESLVLEASPKDLRDTLSEMFYSWISAEQVYDQETRKRFVEHYRTMMQMLEQSEDFAQVRSAYWESKRAAISQERGSKCTR